MKRVYAILLCITILFAVCVEVKAFYSDDLLEEKIEEDKKDEDFKEDEKNKEEYLNNTKNATNMGESSSPSNSTLLNYITGDVPEYVELTPEPTPDPTPDPTPNPTPNPTPTPDNPSVSNNNITVSWNSVSENLLSIEEQIRGLRQDVQQLRYTTFSVSISAVPNIGDDASVSNNIISKPLSEYSTSESIALITLMLAFSALIVYIIHKSIYRWKR